MIYLNSRYANGSLQTVTDTRRGRTDTAVFRQFGLSPRSKTYVTYYWVEGDRIDIVASKYFSDPTQFWKILDENPTIDDPSDLTPGTPIRIPSA